MELTLPLMSEYILTMPARIFLNSLTLDMLITLSESSRRILVYNATNEDIWIDDLPENKWAIDVLLLERAYRLTL